jgi:hypothetical protein
VTGGMLSVASEDVGCIFCYFLLLPLPLCLYSSVIPSAYIFVCRESGFADKIWL